MSNTKVYPLFKVHLDKKGALDNIETVFNSGFINEGVQVNELKKALSQRFQDEKVVLLNSCTSALTIALRLAGVGPGKNVVTSPMTCIASNTPIMNLGGGIRWADIDPASGMVTPETIEAAIDEDTVAILFVDWAGVPADLKGIWDVGRSKGIKVIQDAAHAFMAEFQGRPINAFTDFTCYSFQAIKHFTCGDGGALVCHDHEDYKAANKLKWFGYDREAAKDEKGNWKAQQAEADIMAKDIGYKFNMNNVAAAIGLAQLEHIDGLIAKHRMNAALYAKELQKIKGIKPLKTIEASNPSYWVYTCLLDQGVSRDGLSDFLAKNAIHSGQVHVPNDAYSCFDSYKVDLPGVRSFSNSQISLPCGWWLDEDDVLFIVECITNYLDSCK